MEKSTAGFIGRQKKPGEKKKYGRGVIKENMQIYALMLPTLVLIFIFCYIPMYGLVIAFQDYVPGAPFLGEGVKWVGLRWFDKFISGHYFSRLIKNTLILSGLNLLFGFTAPIFFALLLDQIKHTRFKKFIQTASYMPYFISTVVVAGMVISFIDTDGLVTNLLMLLGFTERIIMWSHPPFHGYIRLLMYGKISDSEVFCTAPLYHPSIPDFMRRPSWTAPTAGSRSGM